MDFYQFDEYCRQNLTSTQERVYKTLLSFKNRTESHAYPSQETLAERANISVRTVKRAIKVLVEKKFLEVEKMKAICGHYNKYLMLLVPEAPKKKNASMEDNNGLDDIYCTFDEAPKQRNNFKGKVLEKTKIQTMTRKQENNINEFTTATILQTLAKPKAKEARSATFFIDLLVDTAIGDGTITQYQIKKYKVILPPVIEDKIDDVELLGWDD